MNITKDIALLLEDFKFQSRGLKNRDKNEILQLKNRDKNEILQLKLNQIISKKEVHNVSNIDEDYREVITTLGNIEIVNGDLGLEFCSKLKDLGNLKHVKGKLYLHGPNLLTSLPENLIVGDILFLTKTNIFHIPESCKIKHIYRADDPFAFHYYSIEEYNATCIEEGLYKPELTESLQLIENSHLKEDFSFQSRGMKNRKETKERNKELKKQKFLKEFGSKEQMIDDLKQLILKHTGQNVWKISEETYESNLLFYLQIYILRSEYFPEIIITIEIYQDLSYIISISKIDKEGYSFSEKDHTHSYFFSRKSFLHDFEVAILNDLL